MGEAPGNSSVFYTVVGEFNDNVNRVNYKSKIKQAIIINLKNINSFAIS